MVRAPNWRGPGAVGIFLFPAPHTKTVSEEVSQDKVYFQCGTCQFTFQEDPGQFIVKCPQCASENSARI